MKRADVKPENRLYVPRGAALDLWRDRSEEIMLSGPAGTGKSRACLEKFHACLEKWPGARGLIVRKTRASLTESGLVTFEDKVLPQGHAALAGPQRRMRQAYHYPNGSEAIVAGMDNATKIMSTEFDMIYVQEAIELTEDDWEKLTTRLRNGVMPFQQIFGDTNPDKPQHWLKLRANRGLTRMLESRHEDNPTLYDAKREEWTPGGVLYVGKLERLTGARYHRLRHGKWVGAEGLVYEDWDRAVHLIDRNDPRYGLAKGIPPEWRRFRVIDFGFTNPFVCLWLAMDPDGRLFLYRELYHTQRIVKVHAAQILRLSQGERIEATICDHDAEDRATLQAEGIENQAAHKAITPGIQAVQERLKIAGDGKPRLFVLRDSLVERDESLEEAKKPYSTEQEFDGYQWPKGMDGKALKEVPVDLDNHGMDALRYGVAYADSLGGGWATNPQMMDWLINR